MSGVLKTIYQWLQSYEIERTRQMKCTAHNKTKNLKTNSR